MSLRVMPTLVAVPSECSVLVTGTSQTHIFVIVLYSEIETVGTCTWGYGVVVSHLLRMRKAPGSNPGISTIFSISLSFIINKVKHLNRASCRRSHNFGEFLTMMCLCNSVQI